MFIDKKIITKEVITNVEIKIITKNMVLIVLRENLDPNIMKKVEAISFYDRAIEAMTTYEEHTHHQVGQLHHDQHLPRGQVPVGDEQRLDGARRAVGRGRATVSVVIVTSAS